MIIKSLDPVEKLAFPRLIKNAQMQVESAKSRLRGACRRRLLMGDTYAFSFKISSCFSHEKIGINEIEDAHKS